MPKKAGPGKKKPIRKAVKKAAKKAIRKAAIKKQAVSGKGGGAVKTAAQIRALKKRFAMSGGGADPVGQCWFKDTGGGDQCIPATQADCTAEGGSWNRGNCPNG